MGIQRWGQSIDYEQEAPDPLYEMSDGDFVKYKGHIDMVRLLKKALVAAKPYIKEHGTQTGWTQGTIDDIRQIDAAIDAATIEVS